MVDDDASVRQLIGRVLSARGYCVLEAAGAQEAIALSRTATRRFDLLITDVVMSRMNGRELAAQLKALDGDLKVLFVSGYGESQSGGPNLDGETPFLQKPFTTYDLARKVRDLCDA